jgi:hypothetical protein
MTRRVVVVALMLLPGLALGQEVEEINPPESPGSQTGPAPPPATPAPPPVVVRTRYSRYRTSWYIGFGLGAGGGRVDADGGNEAGAGMGFSIIRVGWVARPWLLFGFEASTWFRMEGDLFDSLWIQFLHYDLVSTLFPVHDHGFYVKGGLGAGVAIRETSQLIGQDSEEKHTGADIKLGLGYEWQLMTSFNLGVDLTYVAIVAGEAHAHDVTAQLTFTWY